jgi:hypothetical protein
MKVNKLFSIFIDFISRWVVIIPMAILFIIVVFLYGWSSTLNVENVNRNLSQEVKINSTIKNIDLNSEYVCDYSSKEASISAYIKSKKIFSKNTDKKKSSINYLLISGDCLYNWNDKEKNGEKTCGISSFINIADNLLKFGLINPETLSKQFVNLDDYIGMNINTSDVLKNIKCTKAKVPSTISFDFPKQIMFKENIATESAQ